MPGLVTVGTRDGNFVLVNLEAFGTLAVTGDLNRARDLVRSAVVELGVGDDLSDATVSTVGVPTDATETLWRVHPSDPATACT